MKRLLAALCATLLLTTPALAFNEITGAFGLELGGLFLPEQMATGKGNMTDKTPIFFFAPDPAYSALETYYVKIAPTSKTIYEIVAETSYEGYGNGCKNEMETLAGLIKKKYGKIKKNDFMGVSYSVYLGSRSIFISCGLMDDRLRITYSDSEIESKAKQEVVDVKVNEGATQGL